MAGHDDRALHERVAAIEVVMREVRDDVKDIHSAINGPPWERSVRGRLHALEGTSAAVKLLQQQKTYRLAMWEKLVGLLLIVAGPVAAGIILNAFGVT